MNIVHLSDIHFRRAYEPSDDGYEDMLAKMQNPLVPLKECLQTIQAQQAIDLLIISGDLTDSGAEEDYRYLKQFIQRQIGEVQIIVTMGNHDVKSHFRTGWLNEIPSEASYNCIETFDDFYVISFDSAVHGNSNGQVSEAQMKWLDEALKETVDKPVILVTHHHLLEEQIAIPILPESKIVLEKLSNQHILCILNGHTHHSYETMVNNMAYFTAAGMSFAGEDLGDYKVRFEEKYGYHLYQIEKGQLVNKQCHTFSTGNILKTVDMSR